jgi:hypothetical protein
MVLSQLSTETMAYRMIQPPFTLNFREMSARELKDYFQWFCDAIPVRINELARAVKQSPGFESWQPDGLPDSLQVLGNWFVTQVETRPRSTGELQTITARSAIGLNGSSDELTNRTFSLATDVSMYLAGVLLKHHRHLKWHQYLNDKRFADYGQPVLVGLGDIPLNPVRILVTLAYGIASRKQTGRRLRELHDYWSKQAAGALGR